MAVKTATRYEIREWPTTTGHSRRLGRRLRTRSQAAKTIGWLRKQGRSVFASPLRLTVAA